MQRSGIWAGVLALCASACAGDGTTSVDDPGGPVPLPEDGHYRFESRFEPGVDSVSQTGQIFRHLVVVAMADYIGGLTGDIDSGNFVPAAGDVEAALLSLYAFDSDVLGGSSLGLQSSEGTLQTVFDDVSSGKNLQEKFAGNDSKTDHADWGEALLGWGDETSAEGLLFALFRKLDEVAVARVNGQMPWGAEVPVYVTAEGLDLKQLIVKWLLMGVTYSQGTDDYLDDDVEGKGLEASNTRVDGKPYSALEHAWDEGFGYFGGARDYADYTDEEIAKRGFRDTNEDGRIDLTKEACFGASVNAAKRDLGAVSSTDFSGDAFDAFLRGRALIGSAQGELSDRQRRELAQHRDVAVGAWEAAIAATAVHYINELLVDTTAYDMPEQDVQAAAKHFSELKGFSLGLQFNPRSRLAGENFAAFQRAIGDAPVLPGGDVSTYQTKLRAARDLLGEAYAFDAANLGDAQGLEGW